MIALDIFCLVIVVIFLLQGLWYGFLKGLFFLIAWGAAAAGAYFCYDILADALIQVVDLGTTTIRIASIAIGFLVPFITLNIVGRLLHGAISKTAFSIPNRLLGLLLGLLKAIILCTVILTVVHILPLTGSWEQGRSESISYGLYLQELEFFGFDTKQPDIKGFVAEKAEQAVESATEKAAEAAENAVNEATEKTMDAAGKATDKAIEKASEKVQNVKENVTGTKK